jgi:hypothetical protein
VSQYYISLYMYLNAVYLIISLVIISELLSCLEKITVRILSWHQYEQSEKRYMWNLRLSYRRNLWSMGEFISPSRTSEIECATTKTDTAVSSISAGWKFLYICIFYSRRRGVLAGFTARGQLWRNMAPTRNMNAYYGLEFFESEYIVTVQRGCGLRIT